MFSHVFIGVTDFERAHAFYAALTAELNLVQKFRDDSRPWAAWMPADAPRPLLGIGKPYEGEASCGNGQMTALLAPSRAAVERAYASALAHGGTCAGQPGLRPEYHENYYGAYMRDPDGNKLCVCCHQAE
ncbi:VOC family protein [Pseudoduganella sp. LjRoot289]|uniref:VOC family protein n=1 Tax=Pseudoduganella sp. LjRoot289 TaxID=3342314 RepID=UPI003ECD2E3D